MIRQLTCCTLLFFAVQACIAQGRMPPPKGPPMDEIAAAVGLKDTQRASVEKILEQHHAAMMALHDAMRSKHDALEQQTHDNLAKVLTPAQLARFDQWHESHRPPPPGGSDGQGERRGPQGGPGGYGQGMGRPGGQGGQGMAGPGGQGRSGSGGYGSDNQGRRPPPPPGGQFGQGRPPPPPPGNNGDPPPPPPGGDGYDQPPPNGG